MSCQVNKKHNKHVTPEVKLKVLCLMLNQALHGTATAAICWHELLINTLYNHGFKLNPCDYCVTNAIFNKKQCTIIHHVDGTKASHN